VTIEEIPFAKEIDEPPFAEEVNSHALLAFTGPVLTRVQAFRAKLLALIEIDRKIDEKVGRLRKIDTEIESYLDRFAPQFSDRFRDKHDPICGYATNKEYFAYRGSFNQICMERVNLLNEIIAVYDGIYAE